MLLTLKTYAFDCKELCFLESKPMLFRVKSIGSYKIMFISLLEDCFLLAFIRQKTAFRKEKSLFSAVLYVSMSKSNGAFVTALALLFLLC